jgi:hypothetical protein
MHELLWNLAVPAEGIITFDLKPRQYPNNELVLETTTKRQSDFRDRVMTTESHEFDRSRWTTHDLKKHFCLNSDVNAVYCLHEILFPTISRLAILLQTAAKMHSFLETPIAEARDILYL